VHLIGYSMGARVALETLLSAETDEEFGGDWQIEAVHLVGAAVDNEEVELGERYGAAIERRCRLLVNYYSPADDKLSRFFPLLEGDSALGQVDIEHAARAPDNYQSLDVRAELISYDEDGEPVPDKTGENHSGYLGNRSAGGELLDDGVMGLVAAEIAELGTAAH
jgi:pimeloyl-ACP methyl ester carboxylesterase